MNSSVPRRTNSFWLIRTPRSKSHFHKTAFAIGRTQVPGKARKILPVTTLAISINVLPPKFHYETFRRTETLKELFSERSRPTAQMPPWAYQPTSSLPIHLPLPPPIHRPTLFLDAFRSVTVQVDLKHCTVQMIHLSSIFSGFTVFCSFEVTLCTVTCTNRSSDISYPPGQL